MSSERRQRAATTADDRAAGRGFRRAIGAAIAVLLATAGTLAVLGAFAPPRLSAVSVDPAAATTRQGQRLVIALSQPAAVDGATLTITPATPAQLQIDGATVTVRFTGMLDYATDYAIRIDGVRGAATGATGSIATSFTTPDPGVVTLVRSDDGDRVIRSPIAGGGTETVIEADRIGDTAVAGDVVAVTVNDGDGSHVRIVTPGHDPVDAYGPYDASIRALRGTDAGILGWIISRGVDGEREYRNTLVVYDLAGTSASTNVPVEITAPGGAPLIAVDWAWVPGTTSLVVQDQDGLTWLASAIGGDPQLLGSLGTLRGFVPGTATLLTESGTDLLVTDLTTGESAPFGLVVPGGAAQGEAADDGGADDGGDVVGESAAVSTDSAAWIVHHLDPGAAAPISGSSIVRTSTDDDGVELYRTPGAASIILDLCVSPNGQYVAATVTDVGGQAAQQTTVLIDARAGGTRRSVPGGSIDWCD